MTGTHDILLDVSTKIELAQKALALFSRPHPLRPCVLAALGTALFYRYLISRQGGDLCALIPVLTEALLLPRLPAATAFFPTINIFYKLACSLAFRFELCGNPEDDQLAVKFYRYILALPSEVLTEISPLEVLNNLAILLAHKIQSGTEVRPDYAEEIIGYLQKFVALDPLSEHVRSIAKSVGIILLARLTQYGSGEECEQALDLFAEVEGACPSERFPEFYIIQGIAFSTRFQQTSLYDHCRQANIRYNKGLISLPHDHDLRPLALMGIATVLHHQFTHDKQPNSLEESIRYSRSALTSCPSGHLLRPACLALLAGSLRQRYAFFGNAEFLHEADTCLDDVLNQELTEPLREVVMNVIDASNDFIGGFRRNNSLQGLMEEMELQQKRLSRIPAGHSDQLDALRCLALVWGAKFDYTHELADLEEEIKYHAMALAASPPDHYVQRMSLFSLGKAFQKRFLCDNNNNEHSLIHAPPRGDFEESMTVFQSAYDEEYINPRTRYEIACHWAACARGHLLDAEFVGSWANSGSTTPSSQRDMGSARAVPLDCASYYIEMGSLEKAVESLERGRALLWSEMRGLRTSMDQLRASDNASLADRFMVISQELENITTSKEVLELQSRGDAQPDDHHGPDEFGEIMARVRMLERERGEIVDEIRARPGFKNFLKAIPFRILQTAAACGPVIIINHCRYRCDILIILRDSAPALIPTAHDFYDRAAKLKTHLIETRAEYALESKHYQRALRFVLQELYELVGRPVIEKLQELKIAEESRVWWCPTSVFCSLPLHAAGPIESEDGGKRYFSDVYICSYTPTLSALIDSRKGITHTVEPPSILIVGQPDSTLPGVRGEIEVIARLAKSATSLIGARATRGTVTDSLRYHRMAHFACHGTLELERPFDTGFLLHGEERLTLLDIVRSRLSTAEFTLLSVCHAAEWTDEQIPDEALHLTAAMQYCGFRSVVGTLWAMADTDGQDLSEHFYKVMFSEGMRDMPIGERSARALCGAVQRLRRKKKGMTLERWVNFVHYGA
ncbi:CHAT domain-containing protein [Multifurca ochricompacta]|uniref:CHAT domain-containing protein n=1 Tax=Multifurca ochricompacta TaxID=376703 RepID=A0AAD4LZW2_9AGAM|nr:CHAT domain-containing protein [Multifurca ochricompacta]